MEEMPPKNNWATHYILEMISHISDSVKIKHVAHCKSPRAISGHLSRDHCASRDHCTCLVTQDLPIQDPGQCRSEEPRHTPVHTARKSCPRTAVTIDTSGMFIWSWNRSGVEFVACTLLGRETETATCGLFTNRVDVVEFIWPSIFLVKPVEDFGSASGNIVERDNSNLCLA